MSPPRMALGAAMVLLASSLGALSAAAPAPGVLPAQSTQAQPSPAEVFGQEVTLPQRTVIYLQGTANWDSAFDTLVDAYKSVYGYLARQGLKPTGPAMTIYTRTDDTGFDYQAAVPIAESPKTPPQGDIKLRSAPTGKALKFAYRGSYDAMDSAYEAITNYLDEKRIEAGDIFIEEYQTDLTKTPSDRLVVFIYVPTK